MGNVTKTYSLLEYYRKNAFNPVPIPVEDLTTWNSHIVKRRNLYERHLGIPLSLLRDRSIIEFGCGSGENALVLAMMGANLTLVEPNEQVLPRLKDLFKRFGLSKRIKELRRQDITQFDTDRCYDLVIAEGFLYTLPERQKMIQKIANLLNPGGIGVVSFNDRYGILIEFIKRLILWRICSLTLKDSYSKDSLEMAKKLFEEDFNQLKASRPFEAWCKDTMINPFIASEYLWSFMELFPLLENSRCEAFSFSPKWSFIDHFNWYKNTLNTTDHHKGFIDEWRRVFSYILTGVKPKRFDMTSADEQVIDGVAELVSNISYYTSETADPKALESVTYPAAIDEYFSSLNNTIFYTLNREIKSLFKALKRPKLDRLIDIYLVSKTLRSLWGTPYHYISFIKSLIS